MKKNLLLLLMAVPWLMFHAQMMSPTFKTKNKKVDELCKQAREQMLKTDNNLQSVKTADMAKQIAISDGDDLAVAKANATLGWIFLNSNNLKVAEDFVNKAFKNIQGQKQPEAEGMLHHQIGIILDKKSEPKNSLTHYFKAYQYYLDAKDGFRQAQVLGEISRLYMMTNDVKTAEKYGKMQEQLLEKYPNGQLQLSLNNRKIFALMGQQKYKEAYDLSIKSLEIARKEKIDKEIPTFYYSAAGAMFEAGNIPEASKLVNRAIDFAKSHDLDYNDFLVGKSQILMSEGKNAEVESLLKSSISQLHKSGKSFMEMQARDILKDFYANQGKSELAAQQMIIANKIKDSLSSAKQAIALKEVEYQYKDDEKEKLLQSYKTSATQKNWIIGLIMVLGLAAFYSLMNVRKNLKLKQSLFDKKEKLLEFEKENALKQKELAQKEEEKAVLSEKLLKEEQERLKLEKENTDRELASITLYLQEKNKMMEELKAKMDNLLSNSSDENRSKILDITRNIKQSISFEKDWDKIKLHFEKVHPEFFSKLSEICPQLTQNELKHCAYIKMNMSNKETANLLGVDHNTVKMSRYRIKKKLELPQEEDLTQFINNV